MQPGMHKLLELERLTAVLLAAEDWAPAYQNAPQQHVSLIKTTARLQRLTMVHFRDIAKEAPSFIDWYAYARAVIEQKNSLKSSEILAYDVNVVVNQDAVNQQDQAFIKLVFNTVATATELGATSMETEHGVPLGLDSTHNIIQKLTSEQLANLVGMKVDDNGILVPNPNPAYSIDETTRDKIVSSIQNSIQVGNTQQEAADALGDVISNPVRADMIARTETVRAYANGRQTYAEQSGAQAKSWQNFGATDVCVDNTNDGWIALGANFASGVPNVPTHPNDRCIVIYSYDASKLSS
jgi:hypothetical protein